MGVVAAVVAAGACLTWFEPQSILMLRELIWDRYVELKPRAYDASLKVRIVDIDEASLAAHGQWPWPRTRMARLVHTLADYEARAVAFDVIFAEPDRSALAEVFDALRADVPGYEPPLDAAALAAQPDNDGIFAAAMGRLPVVLGVSVGGAALPEGAEPRPLENLPRITFERNKDKSILKEHYGAVSSLPRLQKAAAANAGLDMRTDGDGVTRRVPLVLEIDSRRVAALAATVVAVAEGSALELMSHRPGIAGLAVGDRRVPTDRTIDMRLYDSGSVRERYISATDVLTENVAPAQLAGAIVVVGTGATGLHDLRLTPLENWIPGMEIHAQAIEQILSGSFLERPDWGPDAEAGASLLIGLLLLVATWWRWPLVPPWAIAVAVTVGFGALSWTTFQIEGVLLDAAVPAAALLIAATLERFLLIIELGRERSAVRNAFSRYLAPAVVEQLADDPGRLRLGGETREMTFLFCDVRGFTSISERFENEPEGLTRLINRFLTPMTDEILARRGSIDKYMGDCIMAFWNAPLDNPGHAEDACQAALAMHRALATLNADIAAEEKAAGREPFALRMGVGLNTGRCVVGNMGSEQRFDYSVLGDAVNLASRLEGQSKTYGVDTLIGEATQAAVPNHAALELDLVAVKGRSGGARIFTLLGDNAVRENPVFADLARDQAAMLAAYRSQDWPAARAMIAACRDGLPPEWPLTDYYTLMEERIAQYESDPPGADWDGVYVATTK
jgi:adenylate cyclase